MGSISNLAANTRTLHRCFHSIPRISNPTLGCCDVGNDGIRSLKPRHLPRPPALEGGASNPPRGRESETFDPSPMMTAIFFCLFRPSSGVRNSVVKFRPDFRNLKTFVA